MHISDLMAKKRRKAGKKKVTFWATKKVPKRVKVTFYARTKRSKAKKGRKKRK